MVDFPSGGAPVKAAKWDLANIEGCKMVYIGGISRSVDARGAHEGGGHTHL